MSKSSSHLPTRALLVSGALAGLPLETLNLLAGNATKPFVARVVALLQRLLCSNPLLRAGRSRHPLLPRAKGGQRPAEPVRRAEFPPIGKCWFI